MRDAHPIFRCSFSGASPPLQYTQRRKLIKCDAQTRKARSFRRQGVNRGPVTPFGVVRGFTPRHRLRFEGQLSPPRTSPVPTVWETLLVSARIQLSLYTPPVQLFAAGSFRPRPLQGRFRSRVHWADTRLRTPEVGHPPGSQSAHEARARYFAWEKKPAHVS